MRTLARLVTNRGTAWLIVVITLTLATAGVLLARSVQHEDDVLAFLPSHNPEVAVFSDINKRFGGLDVALVGITAPNIFHEEFLGRLRQVTKDLRDTKGLDHVLSLANIIDFTPDPTRGGVVPARLVETLPTDKASRLALRKKVLSRDHVVGTLVSTDGSASLIYCYLAYGSDPKQLAARIQKAVRKGFPSTSTKLYWGGGPFISSYIYNTTQRDMERLTPWALVAIVLIMVLAFRDLVGSFLALLSTGAGIVLSLGLMGLFGVSFNIVLSSMPVILFAIGSAYGIHVLARYYRARQAAEEKQLPDPCSAAISETLIKVGPTVVAAGLTTAAGLLSFIMMDIRPIQTFGLFTALGILFTLILSLTFIPALVRLVNLRSRQTRSSFLRTLMVRFTVFAARRRWATAVVLALVGGLGVAWAARVDSRMDPSTFFAKGSPPDRAEHFLRENFGGSQFIQLHVQGNMNDPAVLRQIQAIADQVSLMPHVSSVLHVGMAVAQVNEVMVGQRRIPDTSAQLKLLYKFLEGDPSVGQLVTQDRKAALMHIRVSSNQASDLEPLLARIEQLVEKNVIHRYHAIPMGQGDSVTRRRDRITLLIQGLARRTLARSLDQQTVEKLRKGISATQVSAPAERVRQALERFLRSEECAVQVPAAKGGEDCVPKVAAALLPLGPTPSTDVVEQAIAKALERDPKDDLVLDLALSVGTPMEEAWRLERARANAEVLIKQAGLTLPAGDTGKRFIRGVTFALFDLDLKRTITARAAGGSGASIGGAEKQLSYQVNGLPVMHRGLSRSVESNQIRSLGFALILIVLIMATIFRSVSTGLLVATPTLLTLAVIYGGMGYLGVRLDIGTSMLASLILGAGVDYAVHLTSAWYAPPNSPLIKAAAVAADRTGPAIWTNAVMVGAGFLVLASGEARPLQNVGGLTAAAMFTAAIATFLVIPVLARRLCYNRRAISDEMEDSSQAVEEVLREVPETRP